MTAEEILRQRAMEAGIKDEVGMQESVNISEEHMMASPFSPDFEQIKYLSESEPIDTEISKENRKSLWAISSNHASLGNFNDADISTLVDKAHLLRQYDIMCINGPDFTFEKMREMKNQDFEFLLKVSKSKEGAHNNRTLLSSVNKNISINPERSTRGVGAGLSERIRRQG